MLFQISTVAVSVTPAHLLVEDFMEMIVFIFSRNWKQRARGTKLAEFDILSGVNVLKGHLTIRKQNLAFPRYTSVARTIAVRNGFCVLLVTFCEDTNAYFHVLLYFHLISCSHCHASWLELIKETKRSFF